MDTFTLEQRSRCMSKIRNKNTKPEIAVRKILTKLGYRYRLHLSKLPGKPDISITKKKIAVFVNGCFWHQHSGCKRQTIPKTNIEYWHTKLQRNVDNQKKNIEKLEELGWVVIIIWECEVKNQHLLMDNLRSYLSD